ncbi:hypothetical protein [uncultured Campylobacter sp.]|uniref:hypothetical protein n=1 Tax=uncultured Campylobacter sp. TaxID=218934 RepID=UPI002638E05A|nr:hypothetical protein [uncultured Campylobacter sp.]
MKKVIFVIMMFFSALLANDEYHIFVSAFGDDVSEKAIESVRVAVEKKVGSFEGVEKVVSGKFGRYRAIAIKTQPLSGEKIKILINKIKSAGYKEAYAGMVKSENNDYKGDPDSKTTAEEKDVTMPKKRGLRKKSDLFFKEAPEPMG